MGKQRHTLVITLRSKFNRILYNMHALLKETRTAYIPEVLCEAYLAKICKKRNGKNLRFNRLRHTSLRFELSFLIKNWQ